MREMDAQEFVRMFKMILAEQPGNRFAFFLGAGCSLSSGIPTVEQIVNNDWLPKLKKIKTGSDTGVEPSNPTPNLSERVMERRFQKIPT